MINVGKVTLKIANGKARISAFVSGADIDSDIYYETDMQYADYLCVESSDAFLVALLPIAMKKGEDITFESPVSVDLLYGTNITVIPALLTMKVGTRKIEIIAKPYTAALSERCLTATGVSGGVDSFYTILKHAHDKVPEKYRLELITCFFYERDANYAINDAFVQSMKKISNHLEMPFVSVITNINIFLDLFPFEKIHTYRNISCALSLQKGIGIYYYSSGHSIERFSLSFEDSSCYDLLFQKALQTRSFQMISFDPMVSRYEKTKYIVEDDFVQKNLYVCIRQTGKDKALNCGRCFKCLRTITTLDTLSRLEKFSDVFELEYYNKHKRRVWGEVRYKANRGDEFSREILREVKKSDYRLPCFTLISAICVFLGNQFKKVVNLRHE